LGGCLASVLAPSLAHQLGTAENLKVYTFAAPSAGNQDFASYYDRLFTDAAAASTAYRVFNDLDIMPGSWASLPAIAAQYAPAPPCPDALKQLIDRAVTIVGSTYEQVGRADHGSAVPLHGQVVARTVPALSPDPGAALFFQEVGQQHATETYMQLLSVHAAALRAGRVASARHTQRGSSQVTGRRKQIRSSDVRPGRPAAAAARSRCCTCRCRTPAAWSRATRS